MEDKYMRRFLHPAFRGLCVDYFPHSSQPWKGFLLAVFVLSLALYCPGKVGVASAQTWISNGLEGGRVQALAIDPTTPNTLYAGTDGGGVFKTTDRAAHWSGANTGFPRPSTVVSALAIDPTTPNTLYASS